MHEDEEDLHERILRYLQRHPHAAETAEGVNRVWLGRPHTPEKLATVERVLDELVAAGQLEKHNLPGDVAVYRAVPVTD